MASQQMLNTVHTFVVPAFGPSPHLEDCLRSLATQTQRSNLIVTTPASYPGLGALVERYGGVLAVNPIGGGIGRDWNFALAQATTPWVTIAHQDDIYLPRFAEATLLSLQANPNASLALTGYSEFIEGGMPTRRVILAVKKLLLEFGFLSRRSICRRGAKRRVLRFGCAIPCPSVTVRNVGKPLFREDLKVNLDWEAWLRLADAPGAFVYIRECLVMHRIHRASETSSGIAAGIRCREDLMLFREIWPNWIANLLARAYALSYQREEAYG